MAASGLADVAMYEGRFTDAVDILERGAAADVAGKNSDAAADKFSALAAAQLPDHFLPRFSAVRHMLHIHLVEH